MLTGDNMGGEVAELVDYLLDHCDRPGEALALAAAVIVEMLAHVDRPPAQVVRELMQIMVAEVDRRYGQ